MDLMKLVIEDEYLLEYLKGLGYTRLQTGRWIEEVIDEGQGFPYTELTCPFCQYKTQTESKYCPNCGARLKDETD